MRIIVDRGKQPGPVLHYLFQAEKREPGREDENPILYTNMFGETAEELTEELRFSADQNHKVERTYGQYKISFPPGENPDRHAKIGIVDDVLAMREHGRNCQFVTIEHFEKIGKRDVHHLHILWSAVRMDGTWVDDAYERVRLKAIERKIELKWGLQYCPPKAKGERVNTPIGEVKLREQGQTLTKDTLRTALDEALQDQPSMPLLMTRLKAQGYTMQFHEFADGKGVSFGAEGRYFQGRHLGDRYSFQGLSEYAGVDYQPARDDAMLRQLNHMGTEQCQAMLSQLVRLERLPEVPPDPPAFEIQQLLQHWSATSLVEDIWKHSQAELPESTSATFEEYEIQLGSSGDLALYRAGDKVLVRSDDPDSNQRLTQADIDRLQAWQQLTLHQQQEQMQRQAARKAEKEKKHRQEEAQSQQPNTELDRSSPIAPDLER